MEDYKTYLVEKGFSTHTVDSYLFAVRQLHEKVGDQPTNENLLGHKDWLAAHFAAKTVNLRITAINSYLDFTEYQGVRLKKPSHPTETLPRQCHQPRGICFAARLIAT